VASCPAAASSLASVALLVASSLASVVALPSPALAALLVLEVLLVARADSAASVASWADLAALARADSVASAASWAESAVVLTEVPTAALTEVLVPV